MVEKFENKQVWLELYKKEVAGKTKQAHIDFFNTLVEIFENEAASYDKIEEH